MAFTRAQARLLKQTIEAQSNGVQLLTHKSTTSSGTGGTILAGPVVVHAVIANVRPGAQKIVQLLDGSGGTQRLDLGQLGSAPATYVFNPGLRFTTDIFLVSTSGSASVNLTFFYVAG
jgi:hypothetical protein